MQRAYVLVVHHLTGIHRAITEFNKIQEKLSKNELIIFNRRLAATNIGSEPSAHLLRDTYICPSLCTSNCILLLHLRLHKDF